jgi:hypothetical protein
MRIALLVVTMLALALPVGVSAGAAPVGSLSIEDGRGVVVIKGKGIVIGRFERGEVQIVDLSPLDQWSPRVNGVPRGRTVWTRGKEINVYIPGGRYRITVRGDGFSISARGQGVATIDGQPDAAGSTGTYAVGDSVPMPLPSGNERVEFGANADAGASAKGAGS